MVDEFELSSLFMEEGENKNVRTRIETFYIILKEAVVQCGSDPPVIHRLKSLLICLCLIYLYYLDTLVSPCEKVLDTPLIIGIYMIRLL